MKNQPKTNPKTQVRHITIDENNEFQRLDNFLMALYRGVPKSAIYKIIRKGNVRVNKGRTAPSYKLKVGDIVRIPPITQADKPKVDSKVIKTSRYTSLIEGSILYEDEGFMILNKPSGLAVHGGSGINLGLIELLREMRPDCKSLELVHRLDRDTSGCIIISKKRSMLRAMHEMLRENKISKIYHALVLGHTSKQFVVKAPLKKNQLKSGERIVRVDEVEGQASLTKFRLIKKYKECSLVEARPITGRTHQIRVHAQFKENPIASDNKYGNKEFNHLCKNLGLKRLFLHAARLEFKHPKTQEVISISAEYDENLEFVLMQLDKE